MNSSPPITSEREIRIFLPDFLIEEIEHLVESGEGSSQTAIVRSALETYFRHREERLEDERLFKDLNEAMSDPDFLEEQRLFVEDFKDAIDGILQSEHEPVS